MKNEEKSKRRGFDAFIIIYMKVKRVEEKWVWEKTVEHEQTSKCKPNQRRGGERNKDLILI